MNKRSPFGATPALVALMLVALTMLAALGILSACSVAAGGNGTPLTEMASPQQQAALSETTQPQPVAVGCLKLWEGGAFEGRIEGEEAVRHLREYLRGIIITHKSEIMYSDADTSYSFIYEDGTEVSFTFEPGQIYLDSEYWLIEQETKLKLEFPNEQL